MKQKTLICLRASLALAAIANTGPVWAKSSLELAKKAVFEHCPRLAEAEGSIWNDTELAADGYLTKVDERQHPRFGTVRGLEAASEDGSVMILSADNAVFCSVAISGASAETVVNSIRSSISDLADGLAVDKMSSGTQQGVKIETLRTASDDGLYLGVQFVFPPKAEPAPPLIIQQYIIEEQ